MTSIKESTPQSTMPIRPLDGIGHSSSPTGASARLGAIAAVTSYNPTTPPMNVNGALTQDLFSSNVFDKRMMKERLPKSTYQSLLETIESGGALDPSLADVVAAAMKDWAIEKGATHYAHVFFPLTGATAEKHDSFFTPNGDGGAFAEFSGSDS